MNPNPSHAWLAETLRRRDELLLKAGWTLDQLARADARAAQGGAARGVDASARTAQVLGRCIEQLQAISVGRLRAASPRRRKDLQGALDGAERAIREATERG